MTMRAAAVTACAGTFSAARQQASALTPGALASGVIAVAAMFLSQHYGAPVMLMALLLGMAFHFLSQDGRCVAGIELFSTRVLRVAVGLLGAQISFAEIMSLGPTPVLIVLGGVILTIAFGLATSRLLGLEGRFGLLTGGAVAICGASAALAISSVLPKGGTAARDTAFTVVCVTALSTLAMIVYPMVAAAFRLGDAGAGIFLGGTIHDVAQVVGAGYTVSDETGDVATFTKLLRVALLLPVVLTITLCHRPSQAPTGPTPAAIPGFLIVFVGLVAANSFGLLPSAAIGATKDISRWCLIAAIAALGMKTSLKALAQVGAKALGVVVAETVFLAVLVLGIVAIAY
jgi:uncharacterized integral membrane protein (TIGR00698 family)